MKELPKYFAIKNDTDNPLWDKYISWLNDYARKNGYNGTSWNGCLDAYYGVGLIRTCDFGNTGWRVELGKFPEGTVELTLDQWDEIVNGFEFPEKWYCVVTEENKEILDKWRKDKASHFNFISLTYDCVVLSKFPTDDSYFCGAQYMELNQKHFFDYKEITTEQFIKYVLKQKEMENTTLKEKDIVELLGIKYEVFKELSSGKFYLSNINNRLINDEIFNKLNLSKNLFQKELLGYFYTEGAFPFCETLEDLTKLVEALKEEIKKYQNNKKTMGYRKISASNAQRIINIACPSWQENLAIKWSKDIVLGKEINISEEFYQEMRKACTKWQHELFDEIFGKDVEVYPDGTPCLVRHYSGYTDCWQLRYADGKGRFYINGQKSGNSTDWTYHMKLDINNLPVND
jgi:hypothetical protein